jgi:hypothetical protein
MRKLKGDKSSYILGGFAFENDYGIRRKIWNGAKYLY